MKNALKLLEIITPETKSELDDVRELFFKYGRTYGRDFCFQDYYKEMQELPGEYASPEGCLLLAYFENTTAGCVALKRTDKNTCELKRLFVETEFRRKGIGRALVSEIINKAELIDYQNTRLCTFKLSSEALSLYQTFGFQKIPSYIDGCPDDVVCLELKLK